MGQIFRLTSFLNNLLNFLRVIFENMIGTTDKYNNVGVRNVFKATFYQGGHQRVALHGGVLCGGDEEEFPSVSLKVVFNQK